MHTISSLIADPGRPVGSRVDWRAAVRSWRRPLLALAASTLLIAGPAAAESRADWMKGGWGVRVVLPAGNSEAVTGFDVDAFVEPLAKLRTPRWVMLNVSAGANGAYYTTPMPGLTKAVDASLAPDRDLLAEIIERLEQLDYRVLVYFATQGPRNDRIIRNLAGKDRRADELAELKRIKGRWNAFLKRSGKDNHGAVAELCIAPVSKRFGPGIDGWWFDHGVLGDPDSFSAAARSGNPDSVIAWNESHGKGKNFAGTTSRGGRMFTWLPSRSNGNEDYTAGHVTPTDIQPPSWDGNEEIIGFLEKNPSPDGVVGHLFSPMQTHWRRGDPVFEDARLIDWTGRIMAAGAAVTWAVAFTPPEFRHSTIDDRLASQLMRLDAALVEKDYAVYR